MQAAVVCLFAFALASPALSAGTVEPPPSIQVHTEGGAALRPMYRDAAGKPIDAAAFNAGLKAGRHYKLAGMDPAHGTVTLQLLPVGSTEGQAAGGRPLGLAVGAPLPDFKLHTLDGQPVTAASLRGKPTLIDFFFSTCEPCVQEVPALGAFAAAHPELNHLAMTFDSAQDARAFVAAHHFAWPVVVDAQDTIDQVKIGAYPTLLLLDAQGRLVASHVGGIPLDTDGKAPSRDTQLAWLQHWLQRHPASVSVTAPAR